MSPVPCHLLSILNSSMSVNFKKWLYRPVEVKAQGPPTNQGVGSRIWKKGRFVTSIWGSSSKRIGIENLFLLQWQGAVYILYLYGFILWFLLLKLVLFLLLFRRKRRPKRCDQNIKLHGHTSLLLNGSNERGVFGVGSVPVALSPFLSIYMQSFFYYKNNLYKSKQMKVIGL